MDFEIPYANWARVIPLDLLLELGSNVHVPVLIEVSDWSYELRKTGMLLSVHHHRPAIQQSSDHTCSTVAAKNHY